MNVNRNSGRRKKIFKDAFVGAEELCGRTSGKGILINKEKTNLVNVRIRSSESNRGKERHMEDDRRDQG